MKPTDFARSDSGQAVSRSVKNHGWQVTFAGMGINPALGVLYSWSVVSKKIPDDWSWSEAGKSWPYSVACLVFSLIMVRAGRMQDRIGPRIVATIGGRLVGLGMILASATTSTLGYILGFGLLAGGGIGFGYASAIPPAVKWFPAARTGLIAGIVVSGFGLTSVYVAPLAEFLINARGVPATMLTLGIGFLVVVVGLAQILKPLTKDYYGPKNFGANYGLVFTAWGLGGFTLSLLAGWVYDTRHAFAFAYYCSAGLLVVAAP